MNNGMVVERYVKVLLNNKWYKTDFARIRRDDIFKLFEPDGKQVGGVLIAKGSPYKTPSPSNKNESTLTIVCENYDD